MRHILITLAAVGLLATACGADDRFENVAPPTDSTVIEVDGEEILLTSALSGFESCPTLLEHLRSEGAERVGPWGFNDGWYGGPWPLADGAERDQSTMPGVDGTAAGPEDTPATTAAGEGGAEPDASLTDGIDFSGTNVQEAGVDEADIVKTDGERIFIVAGGELVVVDVATRSVIGSVAVPSGDRAQLFIDGDDVLLVDQAWSDNGSGVVTPEVGGPAVEGDIAIDRMGNGAIKTTITRITIDGTTPRIVETLSADGDYVSARAVDGIARIIVRSNPQYSFPFVYPQDQSGEDRAEESNRAAVLDSELTDWLPGYTLTDADGSVRDEGLLVPCEQVHAPTEFAGFGVLSVLTIDVDGSIDPGTTSSVLAPGEIVYASPDSVYVATTTWFDSTALEMAPQQISENISTSIHRFDIGSDSSAAYTASGSVDGIIRDSYSLSEHEGHLRIVTTTDDGSQGTSESFVRVLRETDGELVEIGSVGNIGNGEAVQSVRFQGDVGYVVTFRQVDPLYTIDLGDPENPVVRGELKIPGFSSYLHPIGDGMVIGVGSEADAESGQVTGSKVSLFDVNDLGNPREVATWVGPDSWNNVGWDPHAFLWWAPERLAAIPVQTFDNGAQWAGIVLLKIENTSIAEVGRIDHIDVTGTTGQTECAVITENDLPTTDPSQFSSELEYMVADGGALILDCGDGEAPTASGFGCTAEGWVGSEADRLGVAPEGTVVLCYPVGDGVPQISRSIVLPGGELWTVSSPAGWLGGANAARLQVNDLTTFERLDALSL